MSLSLKKAANVYQGILETRGQSRSTLEANEKWLRRFSEFCEKNNITEVQSITTELIARFRQHMTWTPGARGKLYSQNTLYQCQRMVRSFLRWLHSQDHLLRDVTEFWVIPRPSETFKRTPTVEEMSKLLLTPDETSFTGLRNRAVLELLYGTGLRAEECCGLKLDHVDLASSRVRVVRGKGTKDRLLPLGARLKQVLKRYLKLREDVAGDSEQAFFVSAKGKPLTTAAQGMMISIATQKAGLQAFRPHAIRRSFASHLLDNGADIYVIATLLGHKRLSSTNLYTLVSLQELKKVYQRTHPRARRQS